MRFEVATLLAVVVVASGCSGSSVSGSGSGDFEMFVSDAPGNFSDFSYLNVSIIEARVFSGNFSNSSVASRIFHVNETVDLTEVAGEKREKILDTELDPGTYSRVELYTGNILGVVENESVDVRVPSEKLMIEKRFYVAVNETRNFVFDLDLRKKAAGDYSLMPVISESGVLEGVRNGEHGSPGEGSGSEGSG